MTFNYNRILVIMILSDVIHQMQLSTLQFNFQICSFYRSTFVNSVISKASDLACRVLSLDYKLLHILTKGGLISESFSLCSNLQKSLSNPIDSYLICSREIFDTFFWIESQKLFEIRPHLTKYIVHTIPWTLKSGSEINCDIDNLKFLRPKTFLAPMLSGNYYDVQYCVQFLLMIHQQKHKYLQVALT